MNVIQKEIRPTLDPKWSNEMKDMIGCCWGVDIAQRPTMDDIMEILQVEIEDNHCSGMDSSAKSTKSNKSAKSLTSLLGKAKGSQNQIGVTESFECILNPAEQALDEHLNP